MKGWCVKGRNQILERNREMVKIFVGVAAGVFVGAMVAEIIRKTNPGWLQNLKARITKSAKAAKGAFMEGRVGTETA